MSALTCLLANITTLKKYGAGTAVVAQSTLEFTYQIGIFWNGPNATQGFESPWNILLLILRAVAALVFLFCKNWYAWGPTVLKVKANEASVAVQFFIRFHLLKSDILWWNQFFSMSQSIWIFSLFWLFRKQYRGLSQCTTIKRCWHGTDLRKKKEHESWFRLGVRLFENSKLSIYLLFSK